MHCCDSSRILRPRLEPDQLPLKELREEQKLRNRTPQIAIIGAGIAGASVAHHLHQFARLAQPLGITVFEAEARVGGRIKLAHIYGELFKDIEVGAVAFSEEDWCHVQAMEEVGLKHASDCNDKKHVGVWDGDDFKPLVAVCQVALEIRNVAVSNPISLPDFVREDEELCHVPTV